MNVYEHQITVYGCETWSFTLMDKHWLTVSGGDIWT